METLEQFQQNRQVIEDFTSKTLEVIPSDLGRLLHVAMLRDIATAQYRHDGLAAIYSEGAVNHALAYCHEELLEKILETPLEKQEQDLRTCLTGMEGDSRGVAARWSECEFYRMLLPSGAPGYLRDLFCSNLRVLLGIIASDEPSSISPS